ncbi:hypothetical protein X975_25198, partial [Stegodyphus mimosarum]
MQRKQLERLKPDDSQSVIVFMTDHSYSSLPTSCFNIAPTPCKTPAQYHLVSAELSDDNCSQNAVVPSTTAASLQLLDTSSITPSVERVALTNGPVADKAEMFANDSSALERHKDFLSTSLESLVNFPQNSVIQSVNSCLPAVPSIDIGSGAASHSSDSIRVINSKTFSTPAPQTTMRFTSLEQNGNETTRLKQELFLNKVKVVEKVTSESGVSMDVT